MPDHRHSQSVAGAEPYIILRLAGRQFALPADGLLEMLQFRGQTLRQTPADPDCPCELHCGGETIPVCAPHRRLGLPAARPGPRACILIFRRAGARVGLLADSVSVLQNSQPAAFQAADPQTGRPFPLSRGRLRVGVKWRLVLDLDQLLPPPAAAVRPNAA